MTDPGFSESMDQLVAQGAYLLERAKRRHEAVQSTREQALRTTGEAASSDGQVRVVVDGGGMVTSLVLGPGVLQQNPRQLAAVITEVCQLAASRARAGIWQAYTRLENEGLLKHMPLLLPEPVAPPPAPAPVRAPRRPEVPDDDFGGPVMKEQGW
ncbi:hypothetical protein Lesp02_33380 [Lentzea sp. NBRC 105346]|uniref:YbaB/EbfC family nucleoid-associated protein n=1 Tax=Lentzea sp. NBRC 105346 TaxID=3032205 RepID=UPI00249FDB31|nr:YbaB/EbfC family nucleoid-associated protein [Lentzea sp. NBRC 105346]GLZ31150.1 hypothetical protein Lesp02_33380 [Lentzea sp. NBRC 105346]